MGEQLRRVTILDGHELFTDLIRLTLDRRGYRSRVVEPGALSSEALVRDIVASRPEAVVAGLDLRTCSSDGGTVLHALAGAGHRVLAVTDGGDPFRDGEALARGAHAVATKTMPLNEFVGMVRKTMYGVPVVARLERARLVGLYRGQRAGRWAAGHRLGLLSGQEGKVLVHLMAGRGVREVASLHVVSEHTVRSHVRAVLRKLEVSSQGQAVALAWDNDWGTTSSPPSFA
jgi:DNA-binding NarL/FixJ family response regulator